jgi:hypothetical protein
MIPGIKAVLDNLEDVPEWEKNPDDPVPAIEHQELISIMAVTGLREVLWNRVNELLANHDNAQEFWVALSEVHDEIASDLQRALHGTTLGAECEAFEDHTSLSLEALRKEKP